ncbi:MAG: HAMP domain-containing histidine kinase [Spirochaetaceae bacterium]
MKIEYKSIVLSFLLPIIFILVIITTSILLVNYLKDIQTESISTMYQWEKITSYAAERYRMVGITSEETYDVLIRDFNESIYGLSDVLPEWIIGKKITDEFETFITFWEYIKTLISSNEITYEALLTTELGIYLLENSISTAIKDTSMSNMEIHRYGYFLYSHLEDNFDKLMNFIIFESYFETRLLGYSKAIGRIVNILIIITLILATSISIIVLISAKNYIGNIFLEQKKQELELINHKKNLETLVTQRTDKLQNSLDQLKDTQKQLVESEKMSSLGSLVAGVSHEINTPVGIAVTAASYLEDKTHDFDSLLESDKISRKSIIDFMKVAKETTKMISSNLQRAASLINSFKQVAVDQSSEEIRKFNIHAYIKEILISTNSKFKHTSHSVSVKQSEEFSVKTYPGALAQILTNLLINSLVHGFEEIENGKIIIEIEKLDESAVIHYKDSGKGISHENITKIFDPFFTTKRGMGGSGLGMNIAYNLVTQTLNGSINCTSKLGEGTKFTIKFPHNS